MNGDVNDSSSKEEKLRIQEDVGNVCNKVMGNSYLDIVPVALYNTRHK